MTLLPTLDAATLAQLRGHLDDSARFAAFVDAYARQLVAAEGDADEAMAQYRLAALRLVARETARAIDAAAGSPIERMFLRALVIVFLGGDGLGLLVHRAPGDATQAIRAFRRDREEQRKVAAVFPNYRPPGRLVQLLNAELADGRMTHDEWLGLSMMAALEDGEPLDNCYMVTLQPWFTDVLVDGRSVRPDMFFWVPSRPEVSFVVECDGFETHTTKDVFIRDRKRDRALMARGYQVLRFSGSEINRDPLAAASELARVLWQRLAGAAE